MTISSPIFYIIIIGSIALSIFSITEYFSYDFLLIPTVFAEPIPDDNGIMMYKYYTIEHSVYNPLILASHGLNYYKKYENTEDTKSKEYFINTANWLVNNAKDKEGGRYSLWEFDFPWPWYGGVEPPYYSGYAQAIGLVVLARAYDLTNNEIYLDEANKAFQALLVNYDNDGVMTIEDKNGDLMFFHELAKPGFQKTYILNGQTGALLHIWQYYELSNDPAAKSIFDKGINYLKHNLWKYDTGSWSRYELKPIGQRENLASMEYHKIHIDHLKSLYDITGEPILKEYVDKFNKYCNCLSSNDDRIGVLSSNMNNPQQQPQQLSTNDVSNTENKLKTTSVPTGLFIYDIPKH
jgi:heparosan-N-sulfate-glucuronate 5-epimerase